MKWLKFGDRKKNIIDQLIIIGLIRTPSNTQDTSNADEVTQHGINSDANNTEEISGVGNDNDNVEEETNKKEREEEVAGVCDANDNIEEENNEEERVEIDDSNHYSNASDVRNIDEKNTNSDDVRGILVENLILVENTEDEFLGSDDNSNDNLSNEAPRVTITRSGRISKPYDYTKDFTETGQLCQD